MDRASAAPTVNGLGAIAEAVISTAVTVLRISVVSYNSLQLPSSEEQLMMPSTTPLPELIASFAYSTVSA